MSADDTTERPRFHLSATQVIASALAATTATFAASYLGVAGTVIGAAVASVLTVVGNAIYSHSIQRATGIVPRGMAAACVAVFATMLVVVTTVELVAGRPLSDVVTGKQGSGTSVLGDITDTRKPTPTVTVTVTPSVVTKTPTATVTGTPVTETVTPTATTTGSPSATSRPSSTAHPNPSATPTTTSASSTSAPASSAGTTG